MPITAPVRASDFVNAEDSKLAIVEEICAIGRIATANVEPFQDGYLLRLTLVDRFYRWWLNQAVEHHLFVDSSIVDRFGTTVQIGRPMGTAPKELYAVVTSWRDDRKGAQHLRKRYLENAFGGDATVAAETVTATITDALQLQERPANSPLLPSWTPTKWGVSIRLDPPTVERTLDYLLLERPAQGELSPLVPLGAGVISLVAASPSPTEPIQIGISSQWNDDMMVKALGRWLRGLEKALKDNTLLTPTL